MNNLLLFADSAEPIFENKWFQIGLAFVLLSIAVLALTLTRKKGLKTLTTRAIVYGAVCVSLSAVLNLFKVKTGVLLGGISGSITLLRMLPIVLYAIEFGTLPGVLAGVAYGLIDMLFGMDASGGVLQVLLDYPIAFGLIGLAGLTRHTKQPYIYGTLIAMLGRTIASFISGAVFFGNYAPEGMNVYLYSFVYQLVTVVPDMLLVLLTFVAIQKTKPFGVIVRTMRGVEEPNA
ncbi:MAG: energy-coupled thiamine transporter ThiT [Clostridia bacterium]